MSCCSDCRWWNGASTRPAICLRMNYSEVAYMIPPHRAGIVGNDQLAVLVTGPGFGCVLFEKREPERG